MVEDVLRLFAHPQRRQILRMVYEEGQTRVDDVYGVVRGDIETQMAHNHIPKFEETTVIRIDGDRLVWEGDDFAEGLVELLNDHR